ncbi:MAG: FKBP-type peptidyl-prolyl cis-trans isomerase [Candidatus Saccharibacteria bacterium]|nr:FKBP-type peptidyl-prolyl cis-trans isomerase [Candidatus Saccharibacteria bacterium]
MAKQTKLRERILFGGIAVFMVISTIAMYASMVMGVGKEQPQYKMGQEQSEKYLKELMAKYDKRAKYFQELGEKLSAIYYSQFSPYKTANLAYNAQTIKELKTKDLKIGDGDEIKADTDYRAYYIGWLADGKVFDSSFEKDAERLKAPLEKSNGLIEGWKTGVIGMKIGGVRELSIPADKAYGNKEQGDIPANSPLKFILMAIPPMTEAEKAAAPKLD